MKASIPQLNPASRKQLTQQGVRGYTLAEVMLSIFIIGIGLSSSVICLRVGMQQNETARWTSYVTQVLQDEAETIRLKNWSGISTYPSTETFSPDASLSHPLNANAQRFTFTREVSDVAGQSGLKLIVLTAEWTGNNSVDHELTMAFNYAENGMHDYLYGTR